MLLQDGCAAIYARWLRPLYFQDGCGPKTWTHPTGASSFRRQWRTPAKEFSTGSRCYLPRFHGFRTPVVRAQQVMRPRWTPWDGNQSRLSSSVDRTGTTPLAERLLTALPGTHLPAHVGAFAPKNASQTLAPARWLRAIYSPAAPPLRRLNHAGDEPAHRMLNPAPVEVPSFVMHFIPSLTSLETVRSQAIDQRLPLPRGRTLSSRQGVRFRPTSIRARVTDWSMLFAVRRRLR